MKTKKILTYCFSILCITVVLLLISFMSYKIALYKFNKQSVERGNGQFYSFEDVFTNATDYSEPTKADITESTTGSGVIQVDNRGDNIVSVKTSVVLQTYDLAKKTMKEEILNPPDYLIGLTREGIMAYLAEYMKDLKLSEFEKGLMSYELISFSEDEIFLRKTYNSNKVEYKFYLAIIDGMVTVFYSDLTTVFEYTDIQASDLSIEEQTELMHGKFVKDIEELYGILENYSS